MSDTSISSMRKGGDVESFTRANLTAVALLAIPVGDAIWDCNVLFFFFFSATFVRAISLEPLLAETPN